MVVQTLNDYIFSFNLIIPRNISTICIKLIALRPHFTVQCIVTTRSIIMTETSTPQVTVYSTSWCAFCHTEMQWLERLGVKYTVKDIEADEAAKTELLDKLGGDFRGVPVTDINGDIILGFDRPKLQDSLKKHNVPTTS